MLPREEYIEQSHFFRVLGERLPDNVPLQDLLEQLREEVLATTKLPIAVDYLLAELKHSGVLQPAMGKLGHYFTRFQTYLIGEAENDRGRFDMRVAVEVLRKEADYRAEQPTPQGLFLYRFETLCRNRLSYDTGLFAIAQDPQFDKAWREWIMTVRRQIGIVDFADLVYVRSRQYAVQLARRRGQVAAEVERGGDDGVEMVEGKPILFGEKEGKIAWASRRKDPLYLFSALQRQLNYPVVPRPQPPDTSRELIPQMARRLERLETRIKLLEEDQRGGFDLTQFYERGTGNAERGTK